MSNELIVGGIKGLYMESCSCQFRNFSPSNQTAMHILPAFSSAILFFSITASAIEPATLLDQSGLGEATSSAFAAAPQDILPEVTKDQAGHSEETKDSELRDQLYNLLWKIRSNVREVGELHGLILTHVG